MTAGRLAILYRRGIMDRCPKCGASAKLRCQITSSGIKQIGWWCVFCEQWTRPGTWLTHVVVSEYLKRWEATVDDLPVVADYRENPCAICGALGTELHHWLPQTFAGHPDVVDDWRQWGEQYVYLCKYHHDLWHDLVTPYMPGRGNSRRGP